MLCGSSFFCWRKSWPAVNGKNAAIKKVLRKNSSRVLQRQKGAFPDNESPSDEENVPAHAWFWLESFLQYKTLILYRNKL